MLLPTIERLSTYVEICLNLNESADSLKMLWQFTFVF